MTEFYVNTAFYPNKYMVSNKGNVKNSKTGRILKPGKSKNGYMRVCLCDKGVTKWVYVHRLVALAFVPNIFGVDEVDHIDGNRENNVAENLRWASSKWNKENPITRVRMRKKRNHKKGIIEQYTKSGELVAQYKNIKEASEKTGICAGSISMNTRDITKTAGGFVWKRIINTSYKKTE